MKPSPHPRTVAAFASKASRSAAIVLVLLLVLPGCRGPRVLSGEAIQETAASAGGDRGILHVEAANATPRAVSSFSAACRLSLVTPEGKTVNLDGALIAAEPGSVRLQAWKFDRPVIDLTVTPAGRFLFVRGQDGEEEMPAGFASIPAGGLPTLAPLITELPGTGATQFGPGRFRWPAAAFGIRTDGFLSVHIVGDRVVEMRVLDDNLLARQTIRFANFRALDGVAWPMDWTLTGGLAGTVLLEDVELNPDLPASAFKPPANAKAF